MLVSFHVVEEELSRLLTLIAETELLSDLMKIFIRIISNRMYKRITTLGMNLKSITIFSLLFNLKPRIAHFRKKI
jgi:hypothetical protein